MPVLKRRSVKLLSILTVLAATIMVLSVASAHQPTADTANTAYNQYIPIVYGSSTAPQTSKYDLINELRANAGVPAIRDNPILERNCFEHARYMAENGILTHYQNPSYPYASNNGQVCAIQGNIWFGSAMSTNPWNPDDAVRDWMDSVDHRIWLLYPTSEAFGFSFYTNQANKSFAAAADILSDANFAADEAYNGWPVRYPGHGEQEIPAARYPITLNWRYFGPEPVLRSVRLTTASGTAIAHDATTQMSIGHKGIQIIPKAALPKQSKIMVSVTGHYDGVAFSYSWHFFTGTRQYLSGSTETISSN